MRWHLALAASRMLEGGAAEPGAVVCITCQLGQAVSCDTPDSTSSWTSCLCNQPLRGQLVSLCEGGFSLLSVGSASVSTAYPLFVSLGAATASQSSDWVAHTCAHPT